MSADAREERTFVGVLADGVEHSGYMLELTATAVVRFVTDRRPVRMVGRLVDQLYVNAVKGLPVVTVVGAFMGMVLALQTGAELKGYGAEDQLAKIVAASMAREMGPFITAIILAATAGASIAAELGTMKVSEEIDALELMNVDPVTFLVAPRVVSMALACGLLTIWVDAIGIGGGAVVAHAQFGTQYGDFLEGARQTLAEGRLFGVLSKAIYSGLAKSLLFGLMVGGLACASGLRARGGALGVGRAVRSAVTASVVLTLVIGYLITWIFWA